jgi:hypothetical protein
MKKKRIIIEFIKFFILITPPIFFKIVKKIIIFKKNNNLLDKKYNKNLKIENWGMDFSKSQQNCVILCNGPSLNNSIDQSYDFISNSVKIVVNFSPLSDLFWKLKPDFLVLVDPSFWEENIDKDLKIKIEELVEKIKDIDWNIKIVMPILKNQKNRFTEVLSGVKNINFVNINSKPSSKEFIEDRILEYASNNSSPLFQSVSVASLYFAMNIGFKKIYLFGFDHDWIKNIIIDDSNNLLLMDNHYYDKSKQTYKIIKSNLLEEFRAQYQLHNSYNEIREYAKVLDIKIYNCTKNSLLDSFERINDL